MKLVFQKIIIIMLCIQIGIPSSLFAQDSAGAIGLVSFAQPTAEQMPAAAAIIEAARQLPTPTRAEEKLRRAQLKEAKRIALNAFDDATKIADEVITSVKTYTQYKTHTGEIFPVSHQFGEFGHLLTVREQVKIGQALLKQMSENTQRLPTPNEQARMNLMAAEAHFWFQARLKREKRPDFIFFTLKSRRQEAIEFKTQFEADENKGKDPATHIKILIVEIPDRFEDTLMKDAGLKKKTFSDYMPDLPINPFNEDAKSNFPTWQVVKNGLTAKISTTDHKSALEWGAITAGMYSAVYLTNAISSGNHGWQLPAAMITYGALTTWFYTAQSDRIRNVSQTDILRDFRTVNQFRQGIEQLPLALGMGYLGYSIGNWFAPIDFTQTTEQVVGNAVLSLAGIAVGIARMNNLSKTASKQFLNYNNWINVVLNSVMVAGVVGVTHDLTYMQVTDASLAKTAFSLALILGLYKKKERFEKILMEIAEKREVSKVERKQRLLRKAQEQLARRQKAEDLKRERVYNRHLERPIDFSQVTTTDRRPGLTSSGTVKIEPYISSAPRTCSQLFAK